MVTVSVLFSAMLVIGGFGLQWFVESTRSTDMSILLSSAPNFISAAFLGTLFALWFYKAEIRASVGFSIGLILYEVLQLIIPGRTFDVMDIVASALGLLLSVFILFFYRRIGRVKQLTA